jgi:CubicO group peptidase (beta-lactamase class C family)
MPPAIEASKSIEERYSFGVAARLKAGLGFGYIAATREGGKTKISSDGNRTLEPVRSIRNGTLLEIGTLTKTFTGILVHLAELEGRLKIDEKIGVYLPALRNEGAENSTIREVGIKGDFTKLGSVLEKVYRQSYASIVRSRIFHPLRMRSSGIDLHTRRRRLRIAKVSPGFTLAGDFVPAENFDGAAAAAGGIESNAVDMGRFLEALETPPRGKLGEAIRATFVSGIGWDSEPGNAKLLWKNGITGGYASYLAIDPGAHTGIFIGANTAVRLDALGAFSLGIAPIDSLLDRALGTRKPDDDEIKNLRGKYPNPKPAEDANLPLKSLEIFERFGHFVARYDFGSWRMGALLSPHERSGVWYVTDGVVNVDVLKSSGDDVRVAVTMPSKPEVEFDLEKTPVQLETFPALED